MIAERPLHVDERRGAQLRRARLDAREAEQGAASFGALADPTRLQLACSLGAGDELCVCDLSWIAERPQSLVSHHMKVLKGAGIVSARREGKMTMYRLTTRGGELLGHLSAAASAASV